MRIVIDLQGAQSESRFRGIGRYSLALALGMARNAGTHEIWLVLNAGLGDAIADIRTAFAGLVPPERICVFDIAGHCAEIDPGNAPAARLNEVLREYFIEQLAPDAVLVTSLFEGFVDDAVVSVGSFGNGARTAVILYDLIPLLNPDTYLATPAQRAYYERKILSLRAAGLLLSISDFSRREALESLGIRPEGIVAISTAVDEMFHPAPVNPDRLAALHQRYGLRGPFLMYAPGGFDSRKNIDGVITAFSQLRPSLRKSYQLVIASKLHENDRHKLEHHASTVGVDTTELIFTGYVADADLIELYRACALFVFPSKHEGFGLPALEAMACGAIVIGSSTSSVPEVIGCAEALFDPASPTAIAECIEAVLGDPERQQRLREHSARQARTFSWDHSAQRALRALEQHHASTTAALTAPLPVRRRVAFVSPLPPERTGVADYAVRILPTLLPWFDVELVAHQAEVSLPARLRNLPVRTVDWLRRHAAEYDHIVYQFGNSPFHSHMVELLANHPGVVVLHDFYLSSMLSYEQMTGAMPGLWSRALFHSHGYAALKHIETSHGWERGKESFPSNLEILQNASHVIVHSEYARALARQWYGAEAGRDWSPAQLPRALPEKNDRMASRAALGIADDAFVVCNFGFVAPTKHCIALLRAWLASSLHGNRHCELVFVGENHGGDYGKQMSDAIRAAGIGRRIRISGWTSDEDYLHYLQAADVGVQLRTSSRGETSGTVLDCMIYGLPTVINANGAMAEFPREAVWMLPDHFTQQQLVEALETLHLQPQLRASLSKAALALMSVRNSPERCGRMYKEALDLEWRARSTSRRSLMSRLLRQAPRCSDDTLRQLAHCISRAPDPLLPRQLLVDVSNISRNDLMTGIERVVRNQLLELMQLPHPGYRVEPVYLSHQGGRTHYRYARSYGARLLDIAAMPEGDRPIDIQAGDAFYCADHAPQQVVQAASEGIFANMRARGVQVNFLVHDLLPILRPEFFPAGTDLSHGAYLTCLAENADRLICISAAVANELQTWLVRHGGRQPALSILHHGADLGTHWDTDQLSPLSAQVAERPSFLMVGTIEPRKGHLQSIEAFDQLWASGIDVNLVIVGKEGWKGLPDLERRTIPQIVQRLNSHPELGRRLLWLDGIDDATLQQLYLSSACLLFPSEGEGFGLPLIEAARHGLPLLVRDLAVFREIAGDSAAYFNGDTPIELADAIRDWLTLRSEQRHPAPGGLRWMTWQDNARQLLAIISEPAIMEKVI